MTKDELEKRIETRMENCEDALTHHPDSVAWLARYHELCEVRHLAQQLGPDVAVEPLDPDQVGISGNRERITGLDTLRKALKPTVLPQGGTLYSVLLYSHAKAKEWKSQTLTGRQLEAICANFHVLKKNEGFIPKVSKYGEVEALRVCNLDDGHGLEADLKLYAPFAVELVGLELHMGDKPYRLLDGGSLEPVLRGVHVKGLQLEGGLGAQVQRWAILIEPVEDGLERIGGVTGEQLADPEHPTNQLKAQEGPGQPKPQDPPQDKGDQANGQPAPGKPAQAPKMGKLALRNLVRKLVKDGVKSYGDLERETGEGPDILLPQVQWLCKREYIREFKPDWFMVLLSSVAVKKAVVQALEEHPEGGPVKLVKAWVLDILDQHLNKDPACLQDADVQEALESLLKKGRLERKTIATGNGRVPPFVYHYQLKEPADRSRRRPEYTGTPDGSTPRSWAINLRKAILLYLKGETSGITAAIIREGLVLQVAFDDRLEVSDVEAQLNNLKNRGVVGEAEFKDQASLWKAASR